MPNLGLQLSRTANIFTRNGGSPSILPNPSIFPNLELWLDANQNVLSFAGNNFTDATASVDVNAGVGDVSTGTYLNDGSGNYNFLIGTDRTIRKEGGVWVLGNNHPDDGFIIEYTSTGDVTYPWQATWSSITVTRTATTTDVSAVNDDPVVQWNNRVNGKPHLIQSTLASQPLFKSDVFGRKAVYFSGDALHNSGFEAFLSSDENFQYSYYIVSTSLVTGLTSTIAPAIRLGTSTTPTGWRGMFGATSTLLGYQNSSVIRTVTSSPLVENNFGVFSCQNQGSGSVYMSRNLVREQTIGNAAGAPFTSVLIVGAGNTSGSSRPITSNFSEILVYSGDSHDETTAQQIIDYLVQKWSINTSL